MKPDIELHIDELVLTGVDLRDAFRVAQALRSHLELLMRRNGLPPGLAAGAAIRELPTAQLRETGRGNPEQLGSGVAEAVYSGFKKAQK